MTNHLAHIAEAAQAAGESQRQLRYVTALAVMSGASVSAAAAAAGVTRQTVYRWVADESDQSVDVIWRGERIRVTPEGLPPRIDWRAVASSLTELPVHDAGLDQDLRPGGWATLEVRCGYPHDTQTLRFRVEPAATDAAQ